MTPPRPPFTPPPSERLPAVSEQEPARLPLPPLSPSASHGLFPSRLTPPGTLLATLSSSFTILHTHLPATPGGYQSP